MKHCASDLNFKYDSIASAISSEDTLSCLDSKDMPTSQSVGECYFSVILLTEGGNDDKKGLLFREKKFSIVIWALLYFACGDVFHNFPEK